MAPPLRNSSMRSISRSASALAALRTWATAPASVGRQAEEENGSAGRVPRVSTMGSRHDPEWT